MTTNETALSDSAATKLEVLKSTLSRNVEDHKSKLATDLEVRKHELTLAREDASRSARLAEVIYLEAGQHMRSLNALFWQIPGLAIAVTGGLWFGASTLMDPAARRLVLSFTALADFLLIFVLFRMRYLFQLSLGFQLAYEAGERKAKGDAAPKSGRFRYLVVSLWALLLLGAVAVSVVGACNPDQIEHYSVRERVRQGAGASSTLAGTSAPVASPTATEPTPSVSQIAPPVQAAASVPAAPASAPTPASAAAQSK
jgi:hypothetical protein